LGGGQHRAPDGGPGRPAPPRHQAPCESRQVLRARRDGVPAPLRGAIHEGRPHRIQPGAPLAERAWVACCAGRSGRAPVVDRKPEGGARIAASASRRKPRGARLARYPGDRDVTKPTHAEPDGAHICSLLPSSRECVRCSAAPASPRPSPPDRLRPRCQPAGLRHRLRSAIARSGSGSRRASARRRRGAIAVRRPCGG